MQLTESLPGKLDEVARVSAGRVKCHLLDGKESLSDAAEETAVGDGVSSKPAIDWNSNEADELE